MQQSYAQYHKTRFDMLLSHVQRDFPNPETTILEIGRGPFTTQLLKSYKNVRTLGFPLELSHIAQLKPLSEPLEHIVCDLNQTFDAKSWVPLPKVDVVIFAEVVEHLSTAPEHIFRFLHTAMHSNSKMYCQTPNAVCIHNRLKMVCGLNPYNRILLDPSEPAHVREYTRDELFEITHQTGYTVVEHVYANYFGYENPITRFLDVFCGFIPSFRRGQTVVLKPR